MDLGELLIGLGAGGVLVAALQAFISRRKLGADTAAVLSKTAIDLVKPLSDRIHELEEEVEMLRTKVRAAAQELDDCRTASRTKDYRIREQNDEILYLRQQQRLPGADS